jgi:hypothetical protein
MIVISGNGAFLRGNSAETIPTMAKPKKGGTLDL